MEIQNNHQQAQVTGVSSRGFGFEMNAKMYDILISKMYTNKQGAVIRELSANAWDAHVEAGKPDVPFDLHLPTWLDKSFYIRDYGTGIPHDKFEHIYTNVGASTKEGSNDYIGGFGLGSKTPFTMTDTFMVENYHGGIKSTWICFKDKGEPQVSKVGEEPSDESSGLKVSFSFDEGDVPEFTKQVSRQLRFFPVKPNITGGEGRITFPELPDGWESKEYFYTNTSTNPYGDSNNYLVMGNVAYLLDASNFDYTLRPIFNKGLTIKAPIGAVDIPPSREHLEMTPRTKAYVMEVLTRIKREYSKDVQAQVDKCDNFWELRKVVFDMNGSLVIPQEITWKGEAIDWTRAKQTYITNIAGYSVKGIQPRYSNVYRASHVKLRDVIDGTAKYYVNDLGTSYSKHINETYRGIDYTNVNILHVDGLTVKTKDTLLAEAIKAIKEETGVTPLLLSSIFGFPPKKVKPLVPVGKSEPNQVFKVPVKIISADSSLKGNLEEQGDLPKEGYYMELHHWSTSTDIKRVRDLMEAGLLHFLDKPLYLIRAKTIPKLPKSMILLTEKHLMSLEKVIIEKHKEVQYNRNVVNFVHSISSTHMEAIAGLKDRELKVYARFSNYVRKQYHTFSGDTGRLYQLLFSKALEYSPKLPTKLNRLRTKYEPIHDLLGALCSSYNPDTNKKRIGTLITLINNQ